MSDFINFSGNYRTWDEAAAATDGYDAEIILSRTRDAVAAVRDGRAVFERDSVLLERKEYPFPVVAGLLRAGLASGGDLSVVDFGGSLGSTYFQVRELLAPLRSIRWSVVEQGKHVTCGKAEFETDELKFYYTVEECLKHQRANVLLLSGVLAVLEKPYEMLRGFLDHKFPHIILDRCGFIETEEDRLTIESVPEWVYPASYPSWFFNEGRLMGKFTEAGYSVYPFTGADSGIYSLDDAAIYFKGALCDFEAR